MLVAKKDKIFSIKCLPLSYVYVKLYKEKHLLMEILV